MNYFTLTLANGTKYTCLSMSEAQELSLKVGGLIEWQFKN